MISGYPSCTWRRNGNKKRADQRIINLTKEWIHFTLEGSTVVNILLIPLLCRGSLKINQKLHPTDETTDRKRKRRTRLENLYSVIHGFLGWFLISSGTLKEPSNLCGMFSAVHWLCKLRSSEPHWTRAWITLMKQSKKKTSKKSFTSQRVEEFQTFLGGGYLQVLYEIIRNSCEVPTHLDRNI